ncbi:MAG: RNA polymerase factor sigma-54 [Candidatus Coatesbacteria bacterium]|nr:RNA polymerase factor sigma-54 [Candidatus Coatesbacteria bacterium]
MTDLRPILGLKQQQKLILTQKLQQALKLLILPTAELVEVINREVLENPMLEIDEDATREKQLPLPKVKKEERRSEIEFQDVITDNNVPYFSYAVYNEIFTKQDFIETLATETPTLQEHLLNQLSLQMISRDDSLIGEYIIGNLDERGFLTISEEEIASSLDRSIEDVRKILSIIQTFDPYGVGARDVKESLLIQIRQFNGLHHVADNIVRECWDDFLKRNKNKIMHALSINEDEYHEAIEFIESLDLSPGMIFADTRANYIIPDLFVEKVNDEFYIYLYDQQVPVLRLNDDYLKLVTKKKSKDKDQAYLKKSISSAIWIIKAIEQRRETLIKVMAAIIKLQKPFFDGITSDLNPLTLQDIADEVDLHFTSISRAIANKYVEFSNMTYPMKFFLSGKLKRNGSDIATKNVKSRIKELIENENPKKPYSDQDIVAILSKEGIEIARRTVTKYRENLGIPKKIHRIH